MAAYEITIKRSRQTGQLSFRGGGVTVNTPCWWDPKIVILANAQGYPSYATRMATKTDSVTGEKRPGIWLGKDIKYGNAGKTSNGIFIHEGRSAEWSDGCIVCARAELMKIWNTITPKTGPNVLVKVIDEGATS